MLKAKPVEFIEITDDVIERTSEIFDQVGDIIFFKFGGGYKISVRLRKTSPEDIHFVRDHFGGYYSEQVKDDGKVYWLSLQQLRGRMFLEAIQTTIKKRKGQVYLIFEFYTRLRANGQKRLTVEESAWREEMVNRIRAFNTYQ